METKACLSTVLVFATLLSACASQFPSSDRIADTEAVIEHHRDRIDRSNLKVGEAQYDIHVDSGYWVATDLEVLDASMPDNLVVGRNDYVLGDSLDLSEIAAFLTARTGIPVRRAPELVPKGRQVIDQHSLGRDLGFDDQQQRAAEDTRSSTGLADYIRTPRYRLNLRDVTFEEVLDQVSQAMGVYWRYSRRSGVTFYYYETDSFTIAKSSDGGFADSRSTTASSMDGEGSSSSSSLDAGLRIEPQFWQNTRRVVEDMVSEQGRVLFNEATGSVTVTDNPDVVAQVRDYIDQLNKSLRLKATVNLVVVRLKKTSGRDFNINLDAVYRQAERNLFRLQTSRVNVPNLTGLSVENINPNSAWSGTEAFLDALRSEGEVAVMRSKSFVLRNHSLFSISKGDVIRYLSSASTTNTAQVGATETSEITDLFVGFGLSFYTRILSRDRVLFNVMLDQSDLNQFENIQINTEQTSRVPQTSKEGVIQEYEMRNGESQVLLAFNTDTGQYDSSSNAGCLFGCSRSGSSEQEYLLYILTASLE